MALREALLCEAGHTIHVDCRVLGSTTIGFVLALSIKTVYNYNQACRNTEE